MQEPKTDAGRKKRKFSVMAWEWLWVAGAQYVNFLKISHLLL